ncbi:MAG: hypothetical protein FWD82_01015 [Defluviitaleaceae bacterium]|nr:hypothetical protein [Defluviitaleaceae bacterium]
MTNTYLSLKEEEARILNSLDLYFRELAMQIGAVEFHIPSLIDYHVLEKCGYFSSFPNQLILAARANPDMYKNVIDEKKIAYESALISNKYFTPSACLHVYQMLENEDLESKVVTAKARVYRYEEDNADGVTRLWDFTVREIVFFGKNNYVSEILNHMKQKTVDYATYIGLPLKIITASDNFYPNKKNELKKRMQAANALKFEAVVPINGNDVALASFNFHNTHFSKPFNFDKNGQIVTGCVGFGLERWLAALNEYNINAGHTYGEDI